MTGHEIKLQQRLKQRELAGNLRQLQPATSNIDFYSNDYLGLARSKALKAVISAEYTRLEVSNGSTGSRLLAGNSEYVKGLEEHLATYFQGESALIFNSGYSANTSLLQCVPQKGDIILYDELIHASLKEGARLSFAQRHNFKHNDLGDLERRLARAEGQVYVIVEAVYSMDGDSAPLSKLAELCSSYKAALIIDEAHSTAIYGAYGQGMTIEAGLEKEVFARIYTFGKGPGVHGGCIVGSKTLTDYLINFAMGFIYTTSLPLHSLVAIKESVVMFSTNPKPRISLHRNIKTFKDCTKGMDGVIDSTSPIQAIKVEGGNEKVKRVAKFVIDKGYEVRPIMSPTVKEGEERLRICLHSFNTTTEINELIEVINQAITE